MVLALRDVVKQTGGEAQVDDCAVPGAPKAVDLIARWKAGVHPGRVDRLDVVVFHPHRSQPAWMRQTLLSPEGAARVAEAAKELE